MAKKTIAAARSPLAERRAIDAPDLRLSEARFTGKIIVRGESGDDAFVRAFQSALHTPPPLAPNTAAKTKSDTVLWLGPDEWMVWTPEKERQKRRDSLSRALAGAHSAVVDVSDYYTIVQIAGARARDVLAHGCPLDFRARAFKTGACAQSRFRNAGILLYKKDDAPAYDVQVRRSLAEYLWDYFRAVYEAEAAAARGAS